MRNEKDRGQLIPLLIVSLLVLTAYIKVLVDNIQESDENTVHPIPDSEEFGIIALAK